MVRWGLCLVLALLLLLPARSRSKLEDDEEDERNEEDDDDEEGEDDEEEDIDQVSDHGPGRRAPAIMQTSKTVPITRTTPKRSLECYVCTYKPDTPLKACLDPTKYRVHTITCHSVDDKCFTTIMSKGNTYEAVVRGCRSGCIGTPDTTCCELNRCNNQALALPVAIAPRAKKDKASKSFPPTVFFFVTVLLLLQTAAKVAFI